MAATIVGGAHWDRIRPAMSCAGERLGPTRGMARLGVRSGWVVFARYDEGPANKRFERTRATGANIAQGAGTKVLQLTESVAEGYS